MTKTKILIIGSGPTGMGAAWRLAELKRSRLAVENLDWLMVEQSLTPGGRATSEVDSAGFTWDFGGHVIYSRYRYFDRVLEETVGEDLLYHERKGWVWICDRFVPFPLQHNLHRLPNAELLKCMSGLLARSNDLNVVQEHRENFRTWAIRHFGEPLSELFFLPYAYKMWAFPAQDLSISWTARKSGSRYANVPHIDVNQVLQNLLMGTDSPGWVGAAPFPYCRNGGTGLLWKRMFARISTQNTMLGKKMVGLDTEQRIASFSDGEQIHFDWLISSIPLPVLLECCDQELHAQLPASPLKHTCVHVIGLGFKGPLPDALADKFWIYVPDPELPFFRVTVLSNFSSGNVPADAPHWSVLCEVSESAQKQVNSDTVVAEVEAALRRCFVPADQSVVSRWHRRIPYAYPLPCLGRDEYLAAVEPVLRKRRILSRGRFGGWKYECGNQDSSFMQGVEAVDRILFSTEELTYFQPDLISEGFIDRVIDD